MKPPRHILRWCFFSRYAFQEYFSLSCLHTSFFFVFFFHFSATAAVTRDKNALVVLHTLSKQLPCVQWGEKPKGRRGSPLADCRGAVPFLSEATGLCQSELYTVKGVRWVCFWLSGLHIYYIPDSRFFWRFYCQEFLACTREGVNLPDLWAQAVGGRQIIEFIYLVQLCGTGSDNYLKRNERNGWLLALHGMLYSISQAWEGSWFSLIMKTKYLFGLCICLFFSFFFCWYFSIKLFGLSSISRYISIFITMREYNLRLAPDEAIESSVSITWLLFWLRHVQSNLRWGWQKTEDNLEIFLFCFAVMIQMVPLMSSLGLPLYSYSTRTMTKDRLFLLSGHQIPYSVTSPLVSHSRLSCTCSVNTSVQDDQQ